MQQIYFMRYFFLLLFCLAVIKRSESIFILTTNYKKDSSHPTRSANKNTKSKIGRY
uniref:Uncharacterized protein n=1 Tax=Anguilla anguilla TaxID=7936 RepID=A0A0E9V5S0_ANGAN